MFYSYEPSDDLFFQAKKHCVLDLPKDITCLNRLCVKHSKYGIFTLINIFLQSTIRILFLDACNGTNRQQRKCIHLKRSFSDQVKHL